MVHYYIVIYTVHCTVYSVYNYSIYNYSTVYSVMYYVEQYDGLISYCVYNIVYKESLQFTEYIFTTPYNVRRTLYDVHCTSCTIRYAQCALHTIFIICMVPFYSCCQHSTNLYALYIIVIVYRYIHTLYMPPLCNVSVTNEY